MKKQLEQYFGCEVKVTQCKKTLELPIFMTMRDIKLVEFCGVGFALINIIKESDLTIAAMKKQQKKYEEALQCPIAYEMVLNSVSMRNALVKNGVPFVDLPGNVFLPFMGIVLQDMYRKQFVKADKMMPATQMVFLELLYMEDEESALKSEVAKKLNLTKTSITRATAQLEEMGLIQQVKSGTEISIKRNCSRKEYYENAKEYLINPVQKVITIMRYEATFESLSAGETALSQVSELNPPRIEERAIYKGEEVIDQLEIADARSEDPDDCLKVQLWIIR
ncbi:MAG: winged helix DNA-binding protein [Lachnospiraceae bacterium]|nr:winged helix DNA-binding protein [Lachnospiraceae bacterium]